MGINAVGPASVAGQHFDVVVVGTGFGSAFFLHEALRRKKLRALVVEWGDYSEQADKVARGANSTIPDRTTYRSDSDKPWRFSIAYGGGTNCWYGQTPRMHPNDFRLKSLYGVGQDWPFDYAELEPFYAEAEAVMAISGDPDMARMFPRSTPFPQAPHRMTAVDRLMKAAQPEHHFVQPTARARVATDTRGQCCATARCHLCPVDAKFTANNGMAHVLGAPGVSVALRSKAQQLESAGNSVAALVFEHAGKEHRVTADLFVVGANAIHTPALMLRSGMGGGLTGKGLVESHGVEVEVLLDGLDNFDGSTITTGLNFGLYDGAHRAGRGAAMVEFENYPKHGLRRERGRWRQCAPLVIVAEDLLPDANAVTIDDDGTPVVNWQGASDYAKAGLDRAIADLPKLLAPLPVEDIVLRAHRETERHLQGTMRMGKDPATSVVDDRQLHHRYRNLVAAGTSVMPTCSGANPSLTAAALSLRSARLVV